MAIEHSGIGITTDAIKSKLLDMAETDSNECREVSAFASSKRWQHNNKNISVGSMPGNSKDGGSNCKPIKSHVKCFRCKQIGHYSNMCPNDDKNSSNVKKKVRKQTNAFSAVFLNGNYNKTDWYVDSGASMHLTANENWVENPCYKERDICSLQIVTS